MKRSALQSSAMESLRWRETKERWQSVVLAAVVMELAEFFEVTNGASRVTPVRPEQFVVDGDGLHHLAHLHGGSSSE